MASSSYILGLSAYYHESSAALLRDGQLVCAAAEERFTRQKHDYSFPSHSVEFCLRQGNISPSDLELVAFYEQPSVKFTRILASTISTFPSGIGSFIRSARKWLTSNLWVLGEISQRIDVPPEKVRFIRHHRCHAAHAFVGSGFDNAAILVLDAAGEWDCTSISIGRRDNGTIQALEQTEFPHSLGLIYSAFTAFLGFRPNDGECSTMALAGFGRPIYADKVRQVLRVTPGQGYRLQPGFFQFYEAGSLPFTRRFLDLFGEPRSVHLSLPFHCIPTDDTEVPSSEAQYYADVAASVQLVLEEAVFALAERAKQLTGASRLCLAGGIAHNAVLIGKLAQSDLYEEIYLPPDPGDGGAAVGAAFASWLDSGKKGQWNTGITPYSGERYEPDRVERIVSKVDTKTWAPYSVSPARNEQQHLVHHRCGSDQEMIEAVVDDLLEGKIVGWVNGRFEFGPRALGSRSILADPSNLDSVRRLTRAVKSRASYRPYALSILEEDASTVLDWDGRSLPPAKWMQMVMPVRAEVTEKVRGGLHVDMTTRPQVCGPADNAPFHRLLQEVKRRRGLGVLLNTSLNESGYPMTATPEEALIIFARTEMDTLAVDNLLVRRVN